MMWAKPLDKNFQPISKSEPILVLSYFHTFKLPVLVVNSSNLYGPRQFPEKLIALMILHAMERKPLPVYGEGLNVRDWLYVEDHCEALYSVLINGKIGETYNIGGNEEKSNLEIVKTICKILDDKMPSNKLSSYSELITYVKDRPGHDFRYAIDATKIKNELDWAPKHNFIKAIEKTINWYKKNQFNI